MRASILGFISAVALTIIAIVIVPIVFIKMNGEKLIEESFNSLGGYELTLHFQTEEEIDTALFRNQSPEAIADFLAKGDNEKKAQYLKVFESGLKTKLNFTHNSEQGSSSKSIFVEDGKASVKIYTAVSEVRMIRDPSPQVEIRGLEDLQNQIELLQSTAEEQRQTVDALPKPHETEQGGLSN